VHDFCILITTPKPNIMNEQTPMTTMIEILELLRHRGINNEIRMDEKKNIILQNTTKIYKTPSELKIIKTYRFEGDSNPSDSAALYIIKDTDNITSFLIDSYGAESNYEGSEFDDFLKAIPIDEDQSFTLSN